MKPFNIDAMPPVPTRWESQLPNGWEAFGHWAERNDRTWADASWMVRTGRLDSETTFRLLAAKYLAENVRLKQEVLTRAMLKVEPVVIFKDELK